MRLGDLFHGIPTIDKIHWDAHRPIKRITADSRSLEPGDLFVACRGARMDGHDFLGQAILAKASAVVFENLPEAALPSKVAAVHVPDSRACLTQILSRFYGSPDRKIKLTGVTGTNGKTTIAYLLHRLLKEKADSAYVGTLWYELSDERIPAPNTTPSPETLLPFLARVRKEGIEHCVMEVSSHALDQRRVHGLKFELGIFTQLTQDHLDYHQTMERYFEAKKTFFTDMPELGHALINQDCPYGQRLLAVRRGARSYSIKSPADYYALEIEPSFQGSRFRFRYGSRDLRFQIRLPMMHNVINAVAVLASLDLLGYDPDDFRGALQEVAGIPGRMERVGQQEDFQIFVDYAHTPDAIENVLSAARQLSPRRILTLFGCGGDRDRTKRPLMAQAACRWSDVVMITSDNPRTEDPEQIIQDIRKGIPRGDGAAVRVMETPDRAEAIDKMIAMAEPGDAVFVLGKGHEDYQILGEKKVPFDDRQVIQECLKRKTRVFAH